MPKITINLLPDELKILEKEKTRKALITKIIIIIIITVIIVALITFVQSLLKKNEVVSIERDLSTAQQRVSALNAQEGYLSLLKGRLSSIKTISDIDSQVVSNYHFIFSLVPQDVTLKTIKVGKEASILLGGTANTGSAFNTFLENLTYSDKHQDKIAKINLQNLIKSQDVLSFEITVTLR